MLWQQRGFVHRVHVGELPRELNRLDIKNRRPLPAETEEQVLHALATAWPVVDALLVLDQVSEADCGVVTARVRQRPGPEADSGAPTASETDNRKPAERTSSFGRLPSITTAGVRRQSIDQTSAERLRSIDSGSARRRSTTTSGSTRSTTRTSGYVIRS